MKFGINLRSYSQKIVAASGLFVGLVASFSLVNLALAQSDQVQVEPNERVMTVYDRGQERTFVTKSRTIRQALKAANIEVAEGKDVVEPSLDSEMVTSKYSVNIYRARPVTVIDGSLRQRITTAQQTPEQIAKVAKIDIFKEDKISLTNAEDLLLDGADMVMKINRATPLKFTLYGKVADVRTHAKTVGDFLKEKKITMGQNDTLSLDKSTPITAGMSIELWREGKQTITVEEEVDFPVEKIQDANREIGYRQVNTPGEKGLRNATYEIEIRNGVEFARKEIASVVTKEPKKQVETVGAKPTFTGDFSEALAKLRSCEGGYNSWNPAGPYYGAYQFDQRTWGSVADPAKYGNATPAEQDEAAYRLYLSRGWQPWPVCGRSLPDIYR